MGSIQRRVRRRAVAMRPTNPNPSAPRGAPLPPLGAATLQDACCSGGCNTHRKTPCNRRTTWRGLGCASTFAPLDVRVELICGKRDPFKQR
jgi:hypothetical protein